MTSLTDFREKTEKFKLSRRVDDNNPYSRSKTIQRLASTTNNTPTSRGQRSASSPAIADVQSALSSAPPVTASSPRPVLYEDSFKLRKMGERFSSRNFAQILKDMLREEASQGREKEEGDNKKDTPKKKEGGFISNSTTKISTKKNDPRSKSLRLTTGSTLRENGNGSVASHSDLMKSRRFHESLVESAPLTLNLSPNVDPISGFKQILIEGANKLAVQVTSVQSRLLTFNDGDNAYNAEILEKEARGAANVALQTLRELVLLAQNPPTLSEEDYTKEECREHQQKFGNVLDVVLECKIAVQTLLKSGKIRYEGFTTSLSPDFESRDEEDVANACRQFASRIRSLISSLEGLPDGMKKKPKKKRPRSASGKTKRISRKPKGSKKKDEYEAMEKELIRRANLSSLNSIALPDLEFGEKLGEGAFGDVFKGLWRQTTVVAIKQLHGDLMEEHHRMTFLSESTLMMALPRHPNIVGCLGMCVEGSDCYLVLEFIPSGCLQNYLAAVDRGRFKNEDLLELAKGIAAGMDHLENNHIVHRDLALRNILLEVRSDGQHIPKVSDFGMAKIIEVFDENEHVDDEEGKRKTSSGIMKKIPIKWTSPEALISKKYSSKSDVWAFGVTMWEIYSFGETPYKDVPHVDIIQKIISGDKLLCPAHCPAKVYELMCACWDKDPAKRPTFKQLFLRLQSIGLELNEEKRKALQRQRAEESGLLVRSDPSASGIPLPSIGGGGGGGCEPEGPLSKSLPTEIERGNAEGEGTSAGGGSHVGTVYRGIENSAGEGTESGGEWGGSRKSSTSSLADSSGMEEYSYYESSSGLPNSGKSVEELTENEDLSSDGNWSCRKFSSPRRLDFPSTDESASNTDDDAGSISSGGAGSPHVRTTSTPTGSRWPSLESMAEYGSQGEIDNFISNQNEELSPKGNRKKKDRGKEKEKNEKKSKGKSKTKIKKDTPSAKKKKRQSKERKEKDSIQVEDSSSNHNGKNNEQGEATQRPGGEGENKEGEGGANATTTTTTTTVTTKEQGDTKEEVTKEKRKDRDKDRDKTKGSKTKRKGSGDSSSNKLMRVPVGEEAPEHSTMMNGNAHEVNVQK